MEKITPNQYAVEFDRGLTLVLTQEHGSGDAGRNVYRLEIQAAGAALDGPLVFSRDGMMRLMMAYHKLSRIVDRRGLPGERVS